MLLDTTERHQQRQLGHRPRPVPSEMARLPYFPLTSQTQLVTTEGIIFPKTASPQPHAPPSELCTTIHRTGEEEAH